MTSTWPFVTQIAWPPAYVVRLCSRGTIRGRHLPCPWKGTILLDRPLSRPYQKTPHGYAGFSRHRALAMSFWLARSLYVTSLQFTTGRSSDEERGKDGGGALARGDGERLQRGGGRGR